MTVRRAEPPTNAARIVDEHRALAGLLRELSQANDAPSIATAAGALNGLLCEHLPHEESPDGLRAAVLRASPHLYDRLDSILAEHLALLKGVANLRDLAGSGANLEGLKAAAEDVIANLRDHEARESQLLSAALWEDMGGEG